MLQIDLQAPTLPLDLRVWRLFPGEGYQFLSEFHKQRVGFLDLPGFPVPSGNLAEAKDLIDRVAYSQYFGDLIRQKEQTKAASLNMNDFQNSVQTAGRTRTKNSILAFYAEAKENDLVVLPEPKYLSRVWVGRLGKPTIEKAVYPKGYGDSYIPARAIDWIDSFRENTISSALSESLRTQHAFTLLPKSMFLEVFSLAYSSFVFGERHVSTIYNGSDFLDSDATLLGFVSRLASAACQAMDEDQPGLGSADILNVLLTAPEITYTSTQQCDIHSEGFLRYLSLSAVPLVSVALVAALVYLSEHSSKATLATDIKKMEVINTVHGADPMCTARVSEATARVLKELGIDKTWALCEAAKQAKMRAKINPSAKPR